MKRRHYIAFAIVIVLTIIVLKLPPRTATQFKLAIGSLFLPLFGLASSSQQIAEKAGNAIVPRKDLLKQNEELRRENAEMRVSCSATLSWSARTNASRAMLGFQKLSQFKIKPAHVIARDPANWWRNVQIDLGERDGVRVDFPVLHCGRARRPRQRSQQDTRARGAAWRRRTAGCRPTVHRSRKPSSPWTMASSRAARACSTKALWNWAFFPKRAL